MGGAPSTLVGWLRVACERPGLYFGTAERPSGDVHVLWGWINGYEEALRRLAQPSEHRPFLEWIHQQDPELKRWTDWYGGKLLREAGGDHGQVFEQIGRWAAEFEASRPLRF